MRLARANFHVVAVDERKADEVEQPKGQLTPERRAGLEALEREFSAFLQSRRVLSEAD